MTILKKSFGKLTFPTIRKVYSSLLATDIVSTQPMNLDSMMEAKRELPNYGPFCLGQRLSWQTTEQWPGLGFGDILIVTKIEEKTNGLMDWFYTAEDFTPKQHAHITITCVSEEAEEPYRATYSELKNCFFPDYEEPRKPK